MSTPVAMYLFTGVSQSIDGVSPAGKRLQGGAVARRRVFRRTGCTSSAREPNRGGAQ